MGHKTKKLVDVTWHLTHLSHLLNSIVTNALTVCSLLYSRQLILVHFFLHSTAQNKTTTGIRLHQQQGMYRWTTEETDLNNRHVLFDRELASTLEWIKIPQLGGIGRRCHGIVARHMHWNSMNSGIVALHHCYQLPSVYSTTYIKSLVIWTEISD